MNDRQKAIPLIEPNELESAKMNIFFQKSVIENLHRDLQKANARIADAENDRDYVVSIGEGYRKERDQLRLDLAEAEEILSSISEPTWSDERLSYVEVQMSREDYKALQEYQQKRGK